MITMHILSWYPDWLLLYRQQTEAWESLNDSKMMTDLFFGVGGEISTNIIINYFGHNIQTFTFDKLCEAFSGWAIVQGEAGLAFLLYTETGRLDFWEWETEILVQVIQLIDEVTYIAAQYLRNGH